MLIRLNGISFCSLPHIGSCYREQSDISRTRGQPCIVVREKGEVWDNEARPAYSVRMDGLHVGYIPLVETLMEEKLRARDGFKKVWKSEYQNMTPSELREIAIKMNETGQTEGFGEWVEIPKDEARKIWARKDAEVEACIAVRDHIYTEMERNHLTPEGWLTAVYYDEKEGRNLNEIGDICSLSVRFDIW